MNLLLSNDTQSIFNKLGSKSLILFIALKKIILTIFYVYLFCGPHLY